MEFKRASLTTGEGQMMASFRWDARNPEGPGPVPLGKLAIACWTTDDVMVNEVGEEGRGGRMESRPGRGCCGCLDNISSYAS